MKLKQIYKIIFLVFFVTLSEALAQEKPESTQSEINSSDKEITTISSTNSLSKQSKNELVETLLGHNKITTLMFDDQELENLERAIESLKNNQTYVPNDDGTNSSFGDLSEKQKSEESEKTKKEEELKILENEKSYIYMASLIYFNEKNWIVWINNKKITSKTNDPQKELFIKSIKKDRVKILWKLSLSKWKIISGKKEELAPQVNADNQIEINFELKPNQTFMLGSNKVVEGKAFISLQKN
jgi:hypothetical protein